MIKAAFFDIDWTLFDHHSGRWIESGINAIKKLKENGVKVFLCSARPYDSQKLFGVFDLGIEWDGYIASSGAIAVVGETTVRKQLMDIHVAQAIADKLVEMGRIAEVVTPRGRFLTAPADQYVEAYESNYRYTRPPVHPYCGEETTGFLLFVPEEDDEEIRKVCPEVCYFRFHPAGVDVSGEPHEKGEAIVDVLRYLGIQKEETISFGDDYQDISMGEQTGIFVAMGNGREEVKASADYVTSRVEDDGIEQALKHLHLI